MITLSTSAYEKDFKSTLNKENWFYKVKNPLITKKIVIINNISSIDEFLILKKEFEKDFEFYFSSEYISQINDTFNVLLNPTDVSHHYSIHHYTAILVNNNNYCLHVSPDCLIVGDHLSDFFQNSILLLDTDDDVLTTTLSWLPPEKLDDLGNHCQKEFNIKKTNNFFYFTKVFSDQVYFYKVDKLKKCDFTITSSSHPFPTYGINSFEYRLTNHLIKKNNYRSIYKNKIYYIHKSF